VSILIDADTRVVVQGIGSQGTFHARRNADYGTKVVAGTHPKKGGSTWEGLDVPVFTTVKEAVAEQGANTSMIMVPAPFAADAILEAAAAGVGTIVCITEGIPVHDMARVYNTLYPRREDGSFDKEGRPVLVGPNCPGVISPGQSNVGIIPGEITRAGNVGLVSRSGTLTYQIMYELSEAGIGISTCVGIGGDPIIGSDFLDIIPRFVADPDTEAIVFVGEIGGTEEQRVGRWIAEHAGGMPVVAYVAGFTAPSGKQMGHAGAIVREGGEGGETAADKKEALERLGIAVGRNPSETAELMIQRLSSDG
jgi:succinyl-CoA synthetase alpha subunit